MISFSPSEEQQMIVTMMRQFADDEMRKVYRRCDESGEIPAELLKKAHELGITTTAIPADCGGAGEERAVVTGALVAEELAWGDLATAMRIMSPLLLVTPLLLAGTEGQKKRYLPAFCQKTPAAGAAAIIEPRFNFDPGELATRADLHNDEYRLNGQKCFVPLAVEAEEILVFANDKGVTQGFFVRKDNPGLKMSEREKNMGIKALPTYELVLENCRVAKEDRLGGERGCDFTQLLNASKIALAAMAVGVARAAYEYSREYAKQRIAFGEPIASRQAIAFMLAEMAIEIEATRLMVWEAAWRLDKKQEATKEASLAKFYADDMVMQVTDRALQVLGGHGYIREHPLELFFRNGRGFAVFNGMAII